MKGRNSCFGCRDGITAEERTAFYRRNDRIDRATFEGKLLAVRDSRFKKRLFFVSKAVAERVETSGSRLARLPRVTIRKFLEEFKSTIEAEAVNSFWESRTNGRLKKRPEKLGQELFGVFARTKLAVRGSAIREGTSGIGFVDVLVAFSSGLVHVIELKMLKGKDIPGPAQLATYMNHKRRREGWLVFFDARRPNAKRPVPTTFERAAGTIRTLLVEINPIPPSKKTRLDVRLDLGPYSWHGSVVKTITRAQDRLVLGWEGP